MSKRLGGAPDVTQACMRPCPPDAMPMMGKVGPVRGAYMSAGHNCWGILWAPVSGLSMAELIMDGAPKCVDLRPFAPGRFMQRAAGGRGPARGPEPSASRRRARGAGPPAYPPQVSPPPPGGRVAAEPGC